MFTLNVSSTLSSTRKGGVIVLLFCLVRVHTHPPTYTPIFDHLFEDKILYIYLIYFRSLPLQLENSSPLSPTTYFSSGSLIFVRPDLYIILVPHCSLRVNLTHHLNFILVGCNLWMKLLVRKFLPFYFVHCGLS